MVSVLDVAVVGGGVIGAACARTAARRGLAVAVFEPGPADGAASPASAGMLAAQIEPPDDVMLGIFIRGRSLYPDLAAHLEDSTGIAIGLRQEGIASVALADADAAALRGAVARQRTAGLRCEWLSARDLHARWPGITAAACGGLFAADDGTLDPGALRRALLADATAAGATLVPERVDRVAVDGDRVVGVDTTRQRTAARHVVIAGGAWSPRVAGLPDALPLEPIRGQLALTAWPAGTPPAVLYHDRAYVLPRGTHAVLGSTMERAGFDARPTDEGVAGIRQRAARLLPAIAALPVERAWAGLRPVTPDERPIIGPGSADGLWYATGHGRNGILLAALTGEVVADLITSGATDVDLAPFSPARFAAAA